MINRDEILDKIEEIQLKAQKENIGTNEEDLQVREEVADLVLELVKSNSVLGDVSVLCPECEAPYVCFTADHYYECNSCEHTWTNER